ncbi:MAG: bifunctional 2-C-methyl-D-erythritol 4-phosphate cytidylyltransferase/2-C-methyl-D-erythritol 2,4-cyclodiphosphate synthase [Sphingopyxis sp.]
MTDFPPFDALIVAAGRGERARLDMPKQYAPLGDRAVLRWSVDAFLAHPQCASLSVIISEDDGARAAANAALAGLLDDVRIHLVIGGETRQQSVANGLAGRNSAAAPITLVHDAARPGLNSRMIDALLAPFADGGVDGALPALDVADTLALHAGLAATTKTATAAPTSSAPHALLGETVDRSTLVRVQTPQAFRTARLLAAHGAAQATGAPAATDDAQMVRQSGGRVVIVPGHVRLDKITHQGDLENMARILDVQAPGNMQALGHLPPWRHVAGTGYDVHRLVPGDGMWLCGLFVPYDRRLDGHSDADVALHALTDAVLGAIGAGDIGSHFPPTQAQWRGASSDQFLAHACTLVRARGGVIDHVDVTIICEAPKIGPHRDGMRARLAEIMAVPIDFVSVKATTTERLGFTGRQEGIAAQAVASVAIPRAGG